MKATNTAPDQDGTTNRGTRRPRRRLPIELLVGLLGHEKALHLCQYFGGQQLPSLDRLLRWMRRHCLIADYLNNGYTQPALAAKYGLSVPGVKKIITEYLRWRRTEERAEDDRLRR
jgi:Mor family transcriptional regulator